MTTTPLVTDEAIDSALDLCRRCRNFDDADRARRVEKIRADVAQTAAREPHTLPASAWPLGRPWQGVDPIPQPNTERTDR